MSSNDVLSIFDCVWIGLSAKQMALEEAREKLILLFMPGYYIHNAQVDDNDVANAKLGWNFIIKDTAPNYLKAKEHPDCPFASCISYFYTTFYERLFEIHPTCKDLFSNGIVGQGKFLVKMISITLSQVGDQEVFKESMIQLTRRHCVKGIRAVEYGIVGDVLIHCPDFKMQMKYAQMNVFWNGEFQTLWDCHDETLIHNKLDLILKSHLNLWAARVCVNPLYQNKKDEIQNACEYSFSFNGDEKKRYEKTHYNHVVKNLINASIDASSITHEQYSDIKKESIKRILEPTNSDREIISLNKIVTDVIKEKNSNEKQQ